MDCGHAGASLRRICPHLLAGGDPKAVLRFTGRGAETQLVCAACASAPAAASPVIVEACAECDSRIGELEPERVMGRPVPIARDASLSWIEETITLDERPSSPVVAVAPATRQGRAWIALTAGGVVGQLDLHRRQLRPLGAVPEGTLAMGELALEVSADGRFAAVVNARGQHGFVLDLERGTTALALDRGDYHEDVSSFPVAFTEHRERTLVVHGTAWNRLDISEAETGRLLTARDLESEGAHHLDYFHSALVVSPGGTWIAEDGWVWQPAGVPRLWSLARWLEGNVWESEDGPSCRSLAWRDFWDSPLCWLDDSRLGVGGSDGPGGAPLDLLHVVDAASGAVGEPMACPSGNLAAESGRLYVWGVTDGLSVIEIASGERLLHLPEVKPTAYRGGGEFLTLAPDGSFRVGRVRG
ncbi:MAG TPA: hypothetical protein VMV18_05250 [bacterium]|nr:hypothetical protein [bacterium]